ncbi:RimK family protein [Rhodospira trueperi]|uniref:Glutathione synthase/RimK-type ligase, ATP-grasp superfamily n=1 Tax=Rhodospira trueperi TaxID=69960 RepID=A0A1G7APW1_9PROT|nr:RimK family protein [Rhodospira trueperi]SDE16730.1 Glutathione synthase/RimK-type ligase, ATP-grasp superfamily [Rhodospira trueperi]
MSDWVILTERGADFDQASTPHKVLSVRDYLAKPELFQGLRPIVINLARGYAYQSAGYYASLLAEARGHRVLPTVQTMLELSRKALYAAALPDLEEALNKDARKLPARPDQDFRLLVGFGLPTDPGFQRFATLLFDWFRCPLIEVSVGAGDWLRVKRLRPLPPHRLKPAEREFLVEALARHCRRTWGAPKTKVPLRWSLAVLHNPREAMPPTKRSSLERLAQVGARMGIEVEPIQQRDLPRLAEFDALFIREITSVNDHTFRFARRAEQEGMPVIDDTTSMVRCTNKVYLKERLEAAKLPMPRSVVMAGGAGLSRAADVLGFPMVVKIPDGSFSRGVHKVADRSALGVLAQDLFQQTDLLLAQEFMPTEFDWRVGVLGGQPLFACQYMMARKHWQIIHHGETGRIDEGRFRTFAVENAPAEVVDTAVRAAALMGTGLYGVDLKQNDRGVFVIEINDNPNLDSSIEGAVLKDALWRAILQWFLHKLEGR